MNGKVKKWKWSLQSCPTLWDPTDCSLPGFSVHEIFHARVLEWVVISSSRGSSQPWDRTQVSRIVVRRFTLWARMGRMMIIRVFTLSTGKFYCKSNQNINGIFPPGKQYHNSNKTLVEKTGKNIYKKKNVFGWNEEEDWSYQILNYKAVINSNISRKLTN